MRVEVLFVSECGVAAKSVEAPDGASAQSVLAIAGEPLPAGAGLAVFGRRIEPDARLCEGDRLEVAGALVCDPKKARRKPGRRARRHLRQARGAQAPGQVCLGARRRGRNAA